MADTAPAAAALPDRTLSVSPGGGAPRQSGYTGPSEIGGYRIIRQIGEGGMGTVFEAFETKMNRRVALKILARHLSETESGGDRFAREAWIAGNLNHPSLVRVFERGEDQNARFFSMEFVDGGSLHDVIRTLRSFGKDETRGLVFGTREYLAWAISQVVQTARGLDYAHRHGVVHRDIKPMNILLNREPPGVKVADFGLAVDLKATRMTQAGTVMGTVAYMAPEQIRGRNDLVDGRTDIFALGITLFELLTLELPFSGETQQLYLNAVLTLQARRPRKLNERVGRDLEIVIQKAIEKDPQDRYATIGDFADDLENVLNFRPIKARPPGTATRVVKWVRRRPVHAALAGLMIVALPAIGLLGARAYQHNRLVARMEVEAWGGEARRLLHDGRFDAALAPLGRILEARPGDLDARRDRSLSRARLAMAESDPGRRDELQAAALADITAVAERLPDARWPFRVRAFLLKSFGKEAEAARDEETAARNASAEPDYFEVQIEGILALTANDHAKAVKEFSDMIRMRSDAADARLWRGSAWESLGDPAKAMTDYEVAAALKPSDLVSRLNLARLKTVTGALGDGEELYRQALLLAPADARAHEGLSANLLEQGRAAAAARDADRAGELFRRAEQEARAALAGDPALGWAHLNLGASLMERNRLLPEPDPALVNEAIAEYGKAIAQREKADAGDEVYVKALVNQCDARIQMKSLVEAERDCLRVVDLQPGDAAARYNLAGVYALSGRPDDAFRALEKDYELGDRDWRYLAADQWFTSLRGDPRFPALLERMKRSPAGR